LPFATKNDPSLRARVSSAVGPSGEPDEKTVFPNSFSIDYVRVYQAPALAPVALNEKMVASPDLANDEPESDPEHTDEPEPVP
jgi:hypothetical protein